MSVWSGKFSDDLESFRTIKKVSRSSRKYSWIIQNLAKPPLMRICRGYENWRDLRALSIKFLRQKSCYPESFRFLWLWPAPPLRAFYAPKHWEWTISSWNMTHILFIWWTARQLELACRRKIKYLLGMWGGDWLGRGRFGEPWVVEAKNEHPCNIWFTFKGKAREKQLKIWFAFRVVSRYFEQRECGTLDFRGHIWREFWTRT